MCKIKIVKLYFFMCVCASGVCVCVCARRSQTSDMNTSRVSVTRMATGGRRPVNRAARDALMPDARDRWRKKKGSAPDVECRSPVKVLP